LVKRQDLDSEEEKVKMGLTARQGKLPPKALSIHDDGCGIDPAVLEKGGATVSVGRLR